MERRLLRVNFSLFVKTETEKRFRFDLDEQAFYYCVEIAARPPRRMYF